MKNKYFTVSVIIPTLNSGKTLNACLKSIREQEYPQNKIEIILGDGGSKDNTKEIAKTWKAKIISIPPKKQRSEYNRGVAYSRAKGELALAIDHDNILPYKTWLRDMIDPLLKYPKMVATTTCYYDYKKSYSLIDRYFALYGTSEPLPFYLHKADRMEQISKKWTLQGEAKNLGKYYLVHFELDPRKIPSIGSNGTLMRRRIVSKYADIRPDHHYPIDVMVDVIMSGYNEFGFVKNTIIHLTNSRGFFTFLKRRLMFMKQYGLEEKEKRRWEVYMKGDEIRLFVFIIYSLTFVKPLFDAFRGYFKIHDAAWFLQPLMCFGTTVAYGYVVINQILKRFFYS